MLAEHRADLLPAVDPAQLDLATGDKTEEQTKAASSFGKEPCVFTRRRNSS